MANATHTSLRIAVLANRKVSVKAAAGALTSVAALAPADAFAEYDAEETVEGIQAALRSAGHDPFFLEADETFLDMVRATRPDICFNIAEGLRGDSRESHVPAVLEMLRIPYTAAKVLTHAVSLDKAMTKRIWRDSGLPTAPFQLFQHPEAPLDGRLTFPLFVKPVREGSGMGISSQSIVRDPDALRAQVRWVIETYRQPALAEGYLPGREFTVGLVGNIVPPGESPRSDFYNDEGFHLFPVLEIDTGKGAVKGIYNTQAKSYAIEAEEAPGYLCPADIPDNLQRELYRLAVDAFNAIGALDVGRVDFRLDAEGRPNLVEINTLPGLNPLVSDMVIVSRAEGVAYEVLITEILDLARARYAL